MTNRNRNPQRNPAYQRKAVRWLTGFLAATAFLTASLSHAQTTYQITLNTAPLIQQPAQPFSLDFQLTDGSGLDPADGNNTAVLSNFMFGAGGSASGSPVLTGGVQGNLSGQITLQDSSFLNDFNQFFIPGAFLSFDLTLTNNLDPNLNASPDQFSFAVLDSGGSELPTLGLDAVGSDVFLTTDITGQMPTLQTFSSDSSRSPQAGGPPILLEAPQVQDASPVPEVSTIIPFVCGMIAIGWFLVLNRLQPRPTAKAQT